MVQPGWLRKKELVVGGIRLNIFSDGTSSTKPVGVFFLLHGRTLSAGSMDEASMELLKIAHETPEDKRIRELFVVTFDHRNHGSRTIDAARNAGWRDPRVGPNQTLLPRLDNSDAIDNPSHASDLYSIQLGSAYDVSFLIDSLPSALFPNAERTIDKWMLGGLSLGGHSTWLGLGLDSRISLGIPLIGSPDYLTLLENRAKSSTPPISLAPPIFPEALRDIVRRKDPVNQPLSVWSGKDILVICGETDNLVPFEAGGTKAFTDLLLQHESLKPRTLEIWVQPETGHRQTPDMVARAGKFLVLHGLQS